MGHAVAAAIGGKLAAPDRPVIALVGDAAFAMNGTEVHTAVENDIPVIWVVMNNGGHGMVCHGETLQFQGKFSTGKFRYPLHIAALAQAMGAQGLLVEKPGEFGTALAKAIKSRRPTVIDVIIDPTDMPPLGLRIETLDQFFDPKKPDADDNPDLLAQRAALAEGIEHGYSKASVDGGAGGNGGGNGSGGNGSGATPDIRR